MNQVLMLMGQSHEAVTLARQAKASALAVGDEALVVDFLPFPFPVLH